MRVSIAVSAGVSFAVISRDGNTDTAATTVQLQHRDVSQCGVVGLVLKDCGTRTALGLDSGVHVLPFAALDDCLAAGPGRRITMQCQPDMVF